MSGLMSIIASALIVVFGFIVGAGMNSLFNLMKKDLEDAKRVFFKSKGDVAVDPDSGNFVQSEQNEYSVEDMDPVRMKYDDHRAEYVAKVQLISLFPLAGLLGTVIGIVSGLGAIKTGDFTQLYNSMSTALYTTIAGIVCAIALKLISSRHGVTLDKIENYFDENERQYRRALEMKKLTSREEE